MKHLVIQISSQIVIRAYTKTKERNIPDFLPAVLCFIDTIIEYFKANKAVLKLIERNFSWPLVMEYLSEGNQEEITQILEELLNYPQLRRFDRDEAFRMIYMIVELVGFGLLHLDHRGTAGADRSPEADVIPNGGENPDLKTENAKKAKPTEFRQASLFLIVQIYLFVFAYLFCVASLGCFTSGFHLFSCLPVWSFTLFL